MRNKNNLKCRVLKYFFYITIGILLLLSYALKYLCQWSVELFDISLEEILYTITSPLGDGVKYG